MITIISFEEHKTNAQDLDQNSGTQIRNMSSLWPLAWYFSVRKAALGLDQILACSAGLEKP